MKTTQAYVHEHVFNHVCVTCCCCCFCCTTRSQYGDYFGIGVAGYPEAHPDYIVDDEEQMKKNYWESLDYLKQKVCVDQITVSVDQATVTVDLLIVTGLRSYD